MRDEEDRLLTLEEILSALSAVTAIVRSQRGRFDTWGCDYADRRSAEKGTCHI
jgi:hypothetical protein